MKRLTSAFTDDMNRCYITGITRDIERHHIFGGPWRTVSERYGYVVPLHCSIHPNGARCILRGQDRQSLDRELKQQAQRHFEHHHGSREEFIDTFGRSYL